MRWALVLVISTSMGGSAEQQATETRAQVRTSAPIEVRFELLQAPAGRTLRLDKSSGEVWRLENAGFSPGRLVWKLIPPPKDGERPAFVNYQLVASSVTGDTLLLNVHSGATWVLRHRAGELEWVPLTPDR